MSFAPASLHSEDLAHEKCTSVPEGQRTYLTFPVVRIIGDFILYLSERSAAVVAGAPSELLSPTSPNESHNVYGTNQRRRPAEVRRSRQCYVYEGPTMFRNMFVVSPLPDRTLVSLLVGKRPQR